jgi:hypothetical protein
MGGFFFCRWARRRPRRHLMNGPRPHPSSPRHDRPNRPLGARPHRMRRARQSGTNDCIVWSRCIQLNPSRPKPGPEDSIQSAKPPLSLGALVGCFYKSLELNDLQMSVGNFWALAQVPTSPKMCEFFPSLHKIRPPFRLLCRPCRSHEDWSLIRKGSRSRRGFGPMCHRKSMRDLPPPPPIHRSGREAPLRFSYDSHSSWLALETIVHGPDGTHLSRTIPRG